jgi:hypothetical protein
MATYTQEEWSKIPNKENYNIVSVDENGVTVEEVESKTDKADDIKNTSFYKNASSDEKRRIDDLILQGQYDKITSLFDTIDNGQAKSISEAIEYNAKIDEDQEAIDRTADLTKMSAEATNTISKLGEASRGESEAETEAEKQIKDVMNTVMPNIKRSQALQQALGKAQYNAEAGLPSAVQGAMNSQAQIAYNNALRNASTVNNQQAYNNALFNQALSQGRQNALMDMQYRQQADQNLNRLASEDQALHITENAADVNNAMQKMAFQQRLANRAMDERDSYATARRNMGDTLPYLAANNASTIQTMIARDKIKREQNQTPDVDYGGGQDGGNNPAPFVPTTDGYVSNSMKVNPYILNDPRRYWTKPVNYEFIDAELDNNSYLNDYNKA